MPEIRVTSGSNPETTTSETVQESNKVLYHLHELRSFDTRLTFTTSIAAPQLISLLTITFYYRSFVAPRLCSMLFPPCPLPHLTCLWCSIHFGQLLVFPYPLSLHQPHIEIGKNIGPQFCLLFIGRCCTMPAFYGFMIVIRYIHVLHFSSHLPGMRRMNTTHHHKEVLINAYDV